MAPKTGSEKISTIIEFKNWWLLEPALKNGIFSNNKISKTGFLGVFTEEGGGTYEQCVERTAKRQCNIFKPTNCKIVILK